MPQRSRKLIGTVITVAFLTIYSLLAMALAARLLPETHWIVQLVYYAVAGLVWIVPVGILIRWMQRPDR